MLDVYIDTGILFNDPFWQNNYNKVLLERAKSGKINIYLSNIVTKELHKNYNQHINNQLKVINESVSLLNKRFSITKMQIKIPDKESFIKQFQDFYDEYITSKTFKIIEFENECLPEIVERAVWKKKPFTETKTELKDAIIWLSYSKHVNDNKIQNPYFLTTNINDFCETVTKEDKVLEVHSDLKQDCDSFTVFRLTRDFISEVVEKIEAENQSKFKEAATEKITLDFINEIVFSYKTDIENSILVKVRRYDVREIFNIEYFFTGYISPSIEGWGTTCSDVQIDILDDCAIILGYILIEVEVEGYEYNAGRDSGDDKHNYYGVQSIYVKAYFNFTIDSDFRTQNFDITDIEINRDV